MRLLRRMLGAYRLALSFCPSCNSDAPGIDTCPVCEDTKQGWEGHAKWPWSPLLKRRVWFLFERRDYR
jgi:predicted amidophosphoribosyltransferase